MTFNRGPEARIARMLRSYRIGCEHSATSTSVSIYRERAFARCGGCDSRLLFPSVCVRISPAASYSPPSESAESQEGKEETKRDLRIQSTFAKGKQQTNSSFVIINRENWSLHLCVVSTHLNDVVPAEDSPRVASIAVFSDRAL